MKMFVFLLAIARLMRIALHIAKGVLIVLLVYPRVAERERLALKQRWSKQVLAIFGIELHVLGHIEGHLRVANHVSWLDIFAINALVPCVFVAKEEVRAWPVIGWLCVHAGTIFMRRDARKAARRTTLQLVARLQQGADIVIFPEGTTSDGRQILPFFSALLQPAIDCGVPVQPIMIRYERVSGGFTDCPTYCGDTSLFESMWRIACACGVERFRVQLMFLPASDGLATGRRELAESLRQSIVQAMVEMPPLLANALEMPDSKSGRDSDLVSDSVT